ncbi:extracellular solute-binding protein [Paenibacillus sp. RC67]|uniref:ABC transporter substrate-binding protein n=1 Tax=Paenibacillus sp. RC67 TaxID=3039392 RepID=UPI0024AD586C|nr:extracellular solute-binding protein [Paenibacillus sp. RC67]
MKKAVTIYLLCGALLSGCSWMDDNKTVKVDEIKNQELVLLMPENTTASVKYRIDTFQKYAKQFETANPGVHIKIEKLPGQSYQRDLDARLKEGKQTDLIFGPFYPILAEEGMFADLLSFFKADRMTTDDLYESLTKMVTTKGNLNGIPMSPAPLAVYYNKEWFDKAGIKYPSGDWTWEQYFDISIKLKSANTAADREIYGSTIPFELPFLESLGQSSGTSLLSPDNSKVSGYFDSRPVADAFALLAHHVNTSNAIKIVDNTGNPTLSEMTAGNVGMSIAVYGMNYFLEQNKGTAGKTAVAPLPRLEKGKKVNSVMIQTLSIAAISKQKELAWKFIKDVILDYDSEFHKEWSRQELLTSKSAVQKLNQAADPVINVFLEELNYAITPAAYRNPTLPSLLTKKNIGSTLDATTSTGVQAALTEAAYKIDEQLALKQQQK